MKIEPQPLPVVGGPLDGETRTPEPLWPFLPLSSAGFTVLHGGRIHLYQREANQWTYMGVQPNLRPEPGAP